MNLGCGRRPHPGWINVDLEESAGVAAIDFRLPLPSPDDYLEAVYASHVLEHFGVAVAKSLIEQVYRTVRPGGIVRFVVPDLEEICGEYLCRLARVRSQRTGQHELQYNWIVMELLDQMVRDVSGGEMYRALVSGNVDEAYVRYRNGSEFDSILDMARKNNTLEEDAPGRVKGVKVQEQPRFARRMVRALRHRIRFPRRNVAAKRVPLADPRKTGEVHRWMYDEFSLCRLLSECGFKCFRRCEFNESSIAGWPEFNLDAVDSGIAPWKPHSLYGEAMKPDTAARSD